MIKQVFAGVVAIGSVSGVASAQTYISMSPPPAAFVPPLVVGANPPTTATTAASSRNSDPSKHQATQVPQNRHFSSKSHP
jgi:hypothetical protein